MNNNRDGDSAVIDIAGRMAQQLTDDWRVPVLIMVREWPGDSWTMAPAAATQTAYPTSCTHLAACASAAADAAWDSATVAGSVRNAITMPCMTALEKTAWARAFRLENNVRCALFGCIESASGSSAPDVAGLPDRLRIAAALSRWAEPTLPDVLKSAQANVAFIAAAEQQRQHQRVEEKARRVLAADPESKERMLEALSGYQDIEAVAHLQVACNDSGVASLRHEWIALREEGLLRKKRIDRLSKSDCPLQGAVAEFWDRRLPTHPQFHWLPVEFSIPAGKAWRPQDTIELYWSKLPQPFRDRLSGCDAMVINFIGTKVPRGACDLNPHCEHKIVCDAFAAECERLGAADCRDCTFSPGCQFSVEGKPPAAAEAMGLWYWRLVAVNLVFTHGFLMGCRPAVSFIETTSLLNHLRAEQDALHELVLRGLPHLETCDQSRYLRRLFERCLAIEQRHVKGAAFEQLASGLVALVPGWKPGSRNLHTPENEVDLVVFVEPACQEAKYWADNFGSGIIIECKNHRELDEFSSRIAGEVVSPVRKLHDLLALNDVKLGLILNTGHISDSLRAEAQKTATRDRLVVLFDGADSRHIIQFPADAESFFKKRVSEAKMRLKP